MAIYEPSFAAANFGERFAKRSLPFTEGLDLGTDQHDSGFKTVQQLVVVGGCAILRNNLDAGVLILIGVRFCHKTIIAAATDMLQVLELKRFPAETRNLTEL